MVDLLLFSLLTFISSVIGTSTGFGTSTIMIPILSFFLPFPQTLLFVGVIHFMGDIWKISLFKKGFDPKIILLFGIPGLIVSFFSAKLPLAAPAPTLKGLFGIFLILYTAFIYLKPAWKVKPVSSNAILGGLLSGIFSGIFGIGGAVRSLFLSAFDLPKSIFLFTSGVIGIMIDSGRLTQYVLSGTSLNMAITTILLICVPVSLFGALLAKKIVDLVPQRSFRNFVSLALFIVGIYYVVQI